MKKKILNYFPIIMFVTMIVILLSVSQNANAYYVEPGDGTKKVKPCTLSQNDTLVQVGNTCEEGTKNCASNPCSGNN